MKRMLRVLVLTCAALMAFSLPASAHVIQVTNPQSGETVSTHNGKPFEGMGGWVGGGGAGHVHGLVNACRAITNDVVFIGTTWNPADECTHFTP